MKGVEKPYQLKNHFLKRSIGVMGGVRVEFQFSKRPLWVDSGRSGEESLAKSIFKLFTQNAPLSADGEHE